MIKIDLQITVKKNKLPSKKDFRKWVISTLETHFQKANLTTFPNIEICIRIVDKQEITKINYKYRNKPKPTNILSFPYEINKDLDKIPLLGDLVICPDVIEQEALEYGIDSKLHWQHIVVHGVLHLLGYDHIKVKERKKMEKMEKEILESSYGVKAMGSSLKI